ncbi:MAG: LysR substrate-binding domain-containing protein, partial [Bacteroidota bacterium]
MTLQQLQYALALEKHGNYSRAAKAVHITQPAMSLQIQNLENQLGVLLFDRSKNPISPTPEGKLFLEKAQNLLTQAHQLKSFALELDTEIKGEIYLGVIPTLAPYFISLFIADLNEKYPEIKLHIKEATTEEIIQEVKEGKLHAGIISTPVKGKMPLSIRPLFYESFYLYISYKNPLFEKDSVAIPEIPPSQLWLLKEGNCFRDQVNNICQLKEEVHDGANLWYESNSIDALRRIVEFRGGITF